MKAVMEVLERRSMKAADEIRTFRKGKLELITAGGVTFGRAILEPGWKWSECVKPLVKTNSCEAEHTQYHVWGRLRVRMDDGTEQEFGPGDVAVIPPGHDAWVVGNEPVIIVDVTGMAHYAERLEESAHER